MLSKFAPHVKVDIYEATGKFSEVGAGLGLGPRTRRLLTAIGLEKEVAAIGAEFEASRSACDNAAYGGG